MNTHYLPHGLCDPSPNCHKSSLFTVGPASGVLATVALKSLNRLRKIENGRKFKNIRNQRFGNHPSQQKKISPQKSILGGPELGRAGPSSPELAGAGPRSNREDFLRFSRFPRNFFKKKGFWEILLAKSSARAGQPSETY